MAPFSKSNVLDRRGRSDVGQVQVTEVQATRTAPVLDWGPCSNVDGAPAEWRAYAGKFACGVVQRGERFQANNGGDRDCFTTLEEAQVAEEAAVRRMLRSTSDDAAEAMRRLLGAGGVGVTRVEPVVMVNGQRLTEAQSTALRVAVSGFLVGLPAHLADLGEVGPLYQARLGEVESIMLEAVPREIARTIGRASDPIMDLCRRYGAAFDTGDPWTAGHLANEIQKTLRRHDRARW